METMKIGSGILARLIERLIARSLEKKFGIKPGQVRMSIHDLTVTNAGDGRTNVAINAEATIPDKDLRELISDLL